LCWRCSQQTVDLVTGSAERDRTTRGRRADFVDIDRRAAGLRDASRPESTASAPELVAVMLPVVNAKPAVSVTAATVGFVVESAPARLTLPTVAVSAIVPTPASTVVSPT